jgi:PhnB protein
MYSFAPGRLAGGLRPDHGPHRPGGCSIVDRSGAAGPARPRRADLNRPEARSIAMAVKPIPDGYHAVTPYLIVAGAAAAIEFYKHVFGATEQMRMAGPAGRIGHAELRIGDSVVMLADEVPDMGYRGPKGYGGSAVSLMVYVDDVDATFQRALAAGAIERRAVQNQFYGDRSGTLEDPFGHTWTVSTHIEDLTSDEMIQRAEQAMKQN